MAGACYMLSTNYKLSQAGAVTPWTYPDAEYSCVRQGGDVANLPDDLFEIMKKYLQLWRHLPESGHVWLHSDAVNATVIQVSKQKENV